MSTYLDSITVTKSMACLTESSKTACWRVLTRKFTLGAPEHIEQCTTITGDVAADVIEILARDDFSQQG
jgi:hypothetical protein